MPTLARTMLRTGALLLITALFIGALHGSRLASAAALASPPTATSCVSTGTSAMTCHLWARTGTLTLPNSTSLPIWGYADTATGPATLPGPTISVPAGTTLTVVLHNTLNEASSLTFRGQGLPTDRTGAASTGMATYTFTASKPGTFLYEAGLTNDGTRQVAMGLYGALVVRPATAGQAYNAANSAYNDETVLVLSEIDPALNTNPSAFDLRLFAPKYWLINGAAFPNTGAIDTQAGHKVLLRYLNAGIRDHSVGLLGLHQTVIATDGHPRTYLYQIVAETIPAGATMDTITTVAATAPTGTKYVLYNAALHLDNNGKSSSGGTVTYNTPIGFGGMLTFLNVTSGTPTSDTAGPLSSNLLLNLSTTTGTADVALTATISDSSTGGSTIQAARYFIDTVSGTGISMDATDGTFNNATESVQATITVAQMSALSSGSHTIYVQGQDAIGNWGPVKSVVLHLDKTGPTTSIVLTPSVLNNGPVAVRANGDDTTSGSANVTAAQYTVDGGAAQPMGAPSQIGATASFTATITAPVAEGAHVIQARTQDAMGNWGAWASATLKVDKTAPTSGNVSASPNPNNGSQAQPGSPSNSPSIRVDAVFTDTVASSVNSAIVAAEGFIDTPGATGSGFAFQPTDQLFNTATEKGYAWVPLTTISQLSSGSHTISVHAKDAAGNWGTFATTTLVIDKVAPTFSNVTLSQASIQSGTATVNLTVNGAADNTGGTGVTGGEYWINPPTATAPAPGSGTQFTGSTVAIPTSALTPGTYTISVRIRDAAGNWSTVRTATLTVTAVVSDVIFSSTFNGSTTSPFGWSSATGALSVVSAANLDGSGNGLQVMLNGTTTGYVVNNLPPAAPNNANVTSYHARFYVNPNGANINPTNSTNPPTPTIFAAMSGNNRGTVVFQVQMRRTNTGQYQVRAANQNASASTGWVNITGPTAIEVARSGTTLTLYVGGVSQGTVTVATTNLTAARLGMSTGLARRMSGSVYFDGFISTRNTLIGP